MKAEAEGPETSEIVDVHLVSVVTLMALLTTLWQSGFFSNVC